MTDGTLLEKMGNSYEAGEQENIYSLMQQGK